MRKYLTIRALTEKGLIFMLISVLAIAYLQKTYTIYRVVSTSMAPYLKDGDFVLLKSLEKGESIYKNDIILFDFNNSKIVKRV